MFVPILAYHKVQNESDLTVTRVTRAQFEKQIQYLFESGYRSTSIEQFIKFPAEVGVRSVIITFDDAYASVYENALSVLQKYNFTATLFVITDFVSSWNSWDYNLRSKARHCTWRQISGLVAEGWEIGSHSASHRNLRSLSDKELLYELRKSKAEIEEHIRKPVQIVSYPYGKFDARILRLAKMAGYLGGCTLGYNYPDNQHFPYALFRRGVYSFEPFKLFKLKLKDNSWAKCDDIKQRVITFCSNGSILLRFLKSV